MVRSRDGVYESTFLAIADMTTMKESGKMHCEERARGASGQERGREGERERDR